MAIDQTAELPIDAARAMLNHLRQFPGDASRGPAELAAQFSLPVAFVQNVLANAVRTVPNQEPVLTRQLRIEWPGKLYAALKAGISRFALKPVWFILVVDIVIIGLLVYFAIFVPDSAKIGPVPVELIGTLGSGLLGLILQSVCFFRNRRALLPVQAGFINWAAACSAAIVPILMNTKIGAEQQVTVLVSAGVGITLICVALSAFGVVTALLGNWAYERTLDRRENQLTRQEQLERYYELQGRLERGTRGQRAYHWLERSWFAKWFRRFPVATVMGFWFLMELAQMISATVVRLPRSGGPGTADLSLVQAAGLVLVVGMFVLSLIGAGLIGFLSRSIPRALGFGALGYVTTYLTQGLPIGEYGIKHMVSLPNVITGVVIGLMVVVFSGFAGLAGEMNQRATVRGNVDRNDPAAIVAEMLRIQWRLSEGKQNVCVLVIDAAKSSRMKAEADALEAEYAFRLYQEWIAKTCQPFGGKVHSTAGDGAVVSFADCQVAYAAAKRLQTDIERFNHEENILAMPFRVRIGLHHGSVSAKIDEVEFTEVIDIAAHVEAQAMVGGIAITNDVIAHLDPTEFIPLADEVDGKQLFLARNPTES